MRIVTRELSSIAPGGMSVATVPPRGGSLMSGRAAPVGRGPTRWAPGPSPRYYGGGPHVGIGVFVPIPLEGPVYTHEGQVAHDDGWFGDDQVYLSMTLVNAADGRVLWHLRQDFDVEAENPQDVQGLVNRVVGSIPMRGDLPDPAASQPK